MTARPTFRTLRAATPTGTSHGLACGTLGCRVSEFPTYTATEDHDRFDRAVERRTDSPRLGNVARELGIGVADVSGLMRGARELDAEEWAALHAWAELPR